MEPTRFGSYDLLEKVAVGGMAEVFRARVVRTGGVTKTVCLKRIHPSLCADPSFVGMFIEEARLGLTLSHGNIVPVFDYGCIDGHHFIVMDYVGGRDLASVMARGRIVSRPFPLELATHVVMEVLEGLAYAHGHRDESGRRLELVHRDVSPSNVMISAAGEVKILDFGIARSALREFRTRTGVVKGKPGYMAPEQARGEAVDARADIFACGVLLHELITDERPFADDDPLAAEPRISVDDPDLAEAIAQALEGDRERRFADAREMREALADALDAAGLRPSAGALADHVEALFGAPAATPDWSLAEAVDRHLAAQVQTPATDPIGGGAKETGGEGDAATGDVEAASGEAAGEREDEPVTAPMARAETAESLPPPRRSPWLAIGVAILVVGAAFVAAARVLGPGEPPPETPRAPAGVQGEAGTATVEVRTQPAGATVILDGDEVEGATPMNLTIAPGRHDVEVRLPGHRTARRSVMAQAGMIVSWDAVLQPATGSLVVVSEPPGAEVRLDGAVRGRTPTTIDDLDREAVFTLGLTLSGHEPWSEQVSLGGERRHRVRVELLRDRRGTATGTGRLSVNAHPWAEVILDGRSVGRTPWRHELPAGRHRVVLRNPARGVELTRWVVVRAGQEERVVVDLTAAEAAGGAD